MCFALPANVAIWQPYWRFLPSAYHVSEEDLIKSKHKEFIKNAI